MTDKTAASETGETAEAAEVSQEIQAANLAKFRALVAEQTIAAKAFVEQLIVQSGIEELRPHVVTPAAELSDEFLDHVDNRFVWGDNDNTFAVKRQAYIGELSQTRFVLAAHLSGLEGNADDLLMKDVWDTAALHGIPRSEARIASDALWQAASADEALENFLNACTHEKSARAQREKERWRVLKGQRCLVVDKAPVYYSGWECDDKAWVVEKDGKHVLVTTNHGGHVEGDVEFLQSKLKEYEDAIAGTQRLLALLEVAPAQSIEGGAA